MNTLEAHNAMDRLGRANAPRGFAIRCLLACAWILGGFSICGCQSFGLPAIDPTGNSIFLPAPNKTQVNQEIVPGKGNCFPDSAFPAPKTPPPCLEGQAPGQGAIGTGCLGHGSGCFLHGAGCLGKGHGCLAKFHRGECGQLMLTPTKIVAPVGGEVLLLAGICGEDGYFVTKEPIEWMLTPESVGTFIDVGDDAKCNPLTGWNLKPKVEKLDVDFARGRTSSVDTKVTRGTANPRDDLSLRKGQTWLTVSSPVEGVSRITALAPDSTLWDKRRQTAVIYWLDAQWAFPQPISADSGQPATLVTTVTRTRDAAVAAEDWIVKYRILNPEVARFLPSGSEVAEVRVGKDSRASVQLQQATNQPATAIVAIEVERPADATDNMPALPLGRGQTTVTWSTAQFILQTFGPPSAAPGEVVDYTVQLGNAGDTQASNVVLQANIPINTEIVNVVPPPDTRTNNAIQWNIGSIPARQQFVGNVQLRMVSPGASVLNFVATGSSGLQTAQTLNAEKSIRTEVVQPSLRMRMYVENDLTTVDLGKPVRFLIDIENTGNKTLENIILDLVSAAGLQEVESGNTTLIKSIGFLGPNQRQTVGVIFTPNKEGELCAEVKARLGTSPNQPILASSTACIRAVTPVAKRPGLTVDISPKNGRLQELPNTRFVVSTVVKNTGETDLTNLQIVLQYGPELTVIAAPQASDVPSQRKLIWRIPRLRPTGPGQAAEEVTVEAEFATDKFAGQATIIASATSEQQTTGSDQLAIQVSTPNVVMPPDAGGGVQPVLPNGPPSSPARQGNWRLQLQEFSEPASVGQDARYTITVTNDQNLIDQNLVLELKVSDEAEILAVSSIGTNLRSQFTDQRSVRFEPVREVRPGEKIAYNLTVRPRVPGRVTIEAIIESAGIPQKQSSKIDTEILGN